MNSYPEFVPKYFLHFRQWEGKIHNIKQYLLLYNKHYKDVQRCFYFRENINNNLLPTNETTNIWYSILSAINKNNYVFIITLTDIKDAIKKTGNEKE